ncbi:MAG: DUF488 family protein [Actinomycetota bacterium]
MSLLAQRGASDDDRMTGRIYSVGYEGLTLAGLIDRLVGARVSALVDVRLNPVSRKPGFSRRRLSEALAEAGIDYLHEKELGNPPDNRDSFRTGDGNAGRERMRAMLSNGASSALDRVVELAVADRIAVLCVERDHSHCHRHVITEMVVERNPNIEVLQIL